MAFDELAEGLDRIRAEAGVPGEFPPAVIAAAQAAVDRPPPGPRADRTEIPFATLDPASSIDLDQAFAIEVAGDDIVLRYAIADVGAFVFPGDPLDVEAFQRGVTVYMPDRRATLYPQILSEGAASLLPNVDRPAVVFTVRIDQHGESRLDGVERAMVRSRSKLAYDAVHPSDLPVGFEELFHRITAAEDRRGAPRVEFPEQGIDRLDDGTYRLSFQPRLESEEQNAAMSLATNLAVAAALIEARTGVFRVMPDVGDRQLRRLRLSARAFGLDWPRDVPLERFLRDLPRADPRSSAMLLAVRRAAGGASYATFGPDQLPWHSAMAAPYAQATAPLRRLQDRYVIEAVLAVANGQPVPDEITDAMERLPRAMARADQRAARVDRAVIELAEAAALSCRVGDIFDALVIDEPADDIVEVQIDDPAVLARVTAHRVDPGDHVTVRLESVDVTARTFQFARVS